VCQIIRKVCIIQLKNGKNFNAAKGYGNAGVQPEQLLWRYMECGWLILPANFIPLMPEAVNSNAFL